jgi:hypothetical protein
MTTLPCLILQIVDPDVLHIPFSAATRMTLVGDHDLMHVRIGCHSLRNSMIDKILHANTNIHTSLGPYVRPAPMAALTGIPPLEYPVANAAVVEVADIVRPILSDILRVFKDHQFIGPFIIPGRCLAGPNVDTCLLYTSDAADDM